jgi:heat shock protein HslJ
VPRILFLLILVLALAGCSTGAEGDWVLTSFTHEGGAVDLPAEVTLTVADGRASGSSGCNTYSGQIERDGDEVVLSGVAVTERFCEDTDVMALEARYLDALVSNRWVATVDGDRLTMVAQPPEPGDPAPGTELVFEAAG